MGDVQDDHLEHTCKYKEQDFESNSFLENNLRLIKEVYYSIQNVKGILYFSKSKY